MDLADPRYAHLSHQVTSNPYLQSFEGIFKGFIEQVGVNLSCVYGCMSECLLNNDDVRGPSIQSGCKAVPQAVRRDSLVNCSLNNPLFETALDLSGRDAILQLAEKKCLSFAEDLFSCFQITIQDRSQLCVDKAIDYLSTLGFYCDLLLQQDDILEVKVNQLGKPYSGMQEETDDYQISVCLPALLQSDSFEKNAFFILCQEDWWFSVLVFDLDTDCWIVINLASVGQPPEEAFNRSPGTIDGRCHFLLPIGLLLDRIAKEETIDVSGCYLLNIVVKAKLIQQQIQITLLCSDGMRRSSIGKLMIQELFYCLFDCQNIFLFVFVKYHVQQCSEKSVKSSHTMIINATVQW